MNSSEENISKSDTVFLMGMGYAAGHAVGSAKVVSTASNVARIAMTGGTGALTTVAAPLVAVGVIGYALK